jgi:hypothetical protein
MDWDKFEELLGDYTAAVSNESWHEYEGSEASYEKSWEATEEAKEALIAYIKENVKE